jgi:hypothetical protein
MDRPMVIHHEKAVIFFSDELVHNGLAPDGMGEGFGQQTVVLRRFEGDLAMGIILHIALVIGLTRKT